MTVLGFVDDEDGDDEDGEGEEVDGAAAFSSGWRVNGVVRGQLSVVGVDGLCVGLLSLLLMVSVLVSLVGRSSSSTMRSRLVVEALADVRRAGRGRDGVGMSPVMGSGEVVID